MIKAAKTKKKAPPKPPKTETLRHKTAFEAYYLLGSKRSKGTVARAMGVSDSAVETWSKVFGWKNRIIERDTKLAKIIEKKTDNTLVKRAIEYRPQVREIMTIVRAALQVGVNTLRSGAFKVDSADGLAKLVVVAEKMIRLDLMLMGEPEERRELMIKWMYEDGNGEMPVIENEVVIDSEAVFERKNDGKNDTGRDS